MSALAAYALRARGGAARALIVLSSDAEIKCCPSGEKSTERTAPVCDLTTVHSPRTVGSHSRIVLSREPEAIRLPVGEAATENTGPCGAWARARERARTSSGSAPQPRTSRADARRGATVARTLWPANRKARIWTLKFHTMTDESIEPETSCFIFGLKHTDVTVSRWPRNDRSKLGSPACAMAL